MFYFWVLISFLVAFLGVAVIYNVFLLLPSVLELIISDKGLVIKLLGLHVFLAIIYGFYCLFSACFFLTVRSSGGVYHLLISVLIFFFLMALKAECPNYFLNGICSFKEDIVILFFSFLLYFLFKRAK